MLHGNSNPVTLFQQNCRPMRRKASGDIRCDVHAARVRVLRSEIQTERLNLTSKQTEFLGLTNFSETTEVLHCVHLSVGDASPLSLEAGRAIANKN